MAQTEDRCVALDEQSPACRLQTAGGIDGLPIQCRNFPRSVVETPAGAEVAFLLDCPTVAGVIVDEPKPFQWISKDRADWGFPSVRNAQAQYRWSSDQSISFEALDELRTAWWTCLDHERAGSATAKSSNGETGEWFLGVLAAMVSAPDDPQSNGEAAYDDLVEDLAFQEAAVVTAFVSQLPARGAQYTTRRDELFDALQAPCELDALIVAADEGLTTFACGAGLMLQHAGVHDGMPVSDGIRAAAQQVALAMSLSLALKAGGGVSPRESLQDALTLSSHLYRYRRYSQMVFVD